MSSNRIVAAAAVWSLMCAASTEAATISVTDAFGSSTISIVEGTPSVDVYIRIRADALETPTTIASAQIRFFVGDGGPAAAGFDIVPITAAQYTGTGSMANASIWEPVSADLDTLEAPGLASSSATLLDINIDLANTNVDYFLPGTSASVLAVLTLDTSSLMAGDSDTLGTIGGFLLNPTSVGAPSQAFRSLGGGATAMVPLTFDTGLLQITAIPEPGSVVLLSLGTIGVVAGRRRRRRKRAGTPSETAA